MTEADILVIEDEPAMQRSLRMILERHSYRVISALSGEEGLRYFAEDAPEVVLLDLMLPGMDGIDVCREIRTRSTTSAIVVLSARGDEMTKVTALDLGADDYLTKPFGAQELLARVRVALRHVAGVTNDVMRLGELVIDFPRRCVTFRGQSVTLTRLEYEVLRFMVTHRDRVLTHAMILREVWGPEYVGEAQYLRNIVLTLRRKVEADPARPRLIVTEPGVGYSIRSEPELWGLRS
jgi:two-component system KDP operon response regulator KdpE